MSIRRPFEVMGGAALLARIPLMPSAGHQGQPLAGRPLLEEGMFLASRAVPHSGGTRRPRDDRIAATARAYELRARFRPTPHGVFAGVAVAHAGSDPELFLGAGHRARTYPHPAWLAAFADRALDRSEVLAKVTLATSNLAVRRGDRLEREQEVIPGVSGPQLVSVRATEVTVMILERCRPGAAYETVAASIARAWPQAPEPLIRSTVLALVRAGFLLTDLVPGMDHPDPLGYLIGRLPGAPSLSEPLGLLRAHLHDADRTPPGTPQRIASLAAARDVCDQFADMPRPLSADVAVDAGIVIPDVLLREATEAAGVLWRIAQADDPLAPYHQHFLDRYGPDRFVPLTEATDPLSRLGEPGHPDVPNPPATLHPERAGILADLIADAAAHGSIETEISDEMIDALDRPPSDLPPPPTAEVYVRVLAEDGGQPSVAFYGGGSQQAGSTAGRFATLLPETAGVVSIDCGEALTAEIVVRPRSPELAGLAPPAGSGWPRIPVGTPVRPGDLDLDDLLLVSSGGGLILWSKDRNRRVVPVMLSRVGPAFMPPAARLLAGLAAHGCRPWHGWSWEPVHDSPFQPRIRYKRTILSSARWRLSAALASAARDRSRWDTALTEWQTATVPRPPDTVVINDDDRLLPLDLRQGTDRDLLRRYLRRGITAVTELPGGCAEAGAVVHGPDGRHVLELVIPLGRRDSAAPPEPPLPVQACPRPMGRGRHLPGSRWLSAVIPALPQCHEDILHSLARLAEQEAGHFDSWFWIRFRNETHGPHLRARFHGDPAMLAGRVLPALSDWCDDLAARNLVGGLVLEPYDQETERYGGSQAITAAETVFHADSRLVLAALPNVADADTRIVIAALSAAGIARAVAGGTRKAVEVGGLDRPGRHRVAELRPLARKAADAGLDGFAPQLAGAWADRDSALRAYRTVVSDDRRADCASSMIHMHANRLLGDTASERLARALASDLLGRKEPQ